MAPNWYYQMRSDFILFFYLEVLFSYFNSADHDETPIVHTRYLVLGARILVFSGVSLLVVLLQ